MFDFLIEFILSVIYLFCAFILSAMKFHICGFICNPPTTQWYNQSKRATWATRATDQHHQCHIECFLNLRAGQPGQSKGQPGQPGVVTPLPPLPLTIYPGLGPALAGLPATLLIKFEAPICLRSKMSS